MRDHRSLAHGVNDVEGVFVVLIAVAAFALWLLARPGGSRRWKLVSASALASAALALLVNQLIADVWHRARPYESHPSAYHLSNSHDPSFPSDHASAAFGIAFAVLLFDWASGALFVAAAVVIAVGRVFIGAHYPGDVLAGCLVGLACAVLVVRVARPLLTRLVRMAERLTDPVVAPAWRLIARR
jgi:undecaprenyl-diphosphatase